MKTYLDMDEILRHCRRYIGQEHDEPYLVSAIPEEVIRSLPPADVTPVTHGEWIDGEWTTEDDWGCFNHHVIICSNCMKHFDYRTAEKSNYCPSCGAKMNGVQN